MSEDPEVLATVAGVEIHRGFTVGNVVSILTSVGSAALATGGIVWVIAIWVGGVNAQQEALAHNLTTFKEDVTRDIGSVRDENRNSARRTQDEIRDLRGTVDQILLQRRGDDAVPRGKEQPG